MKLSNACGLTVYSHNVASTKKLTETSGTYTATYNGQPYTLPQEYAGLSACAPVAYGVGIPTTKE